MIHDETKDALISDPAIAAYLWKQPDAVGKESLERTLEEAAPPAPNSTPPPARRPARR